MSDDELFTSVGEALQRRPGWHYEPSSTPGGPPAWCLEQAGQIVLSVSVYDGVVIAYVPQTDHDVAVDGVAGLERWLDAYGDRYLAG